jgi:hypothetical protein
MVSGKLRVQYNGSYRTKEIEMGALLNESRRIISLTAQTNDETNYWNVGKYGVRSITVEAVNGEMASMPWFAIERDNGDFSRLNALFVYSVEYEPSPPPDEHGAADEGE